MLKWGGREDRRHMKWILEMSVVAAAVTTTFAPVAQALPDAPAAEAEIAASFAANRLKEMLEAVNSGDAARIKAYVQAAATKPDPGSVDYLRDLHRRSHGL